jgi:heme oxygenase (mycobilin-producing)
VKGTSVTTPANTPENPAGSTVFRVMLRLSIIPGMEPDFERTWLSVGSVITDQRANLGQWLLKSNDEPGVYYIMSDWVNEPLFREFERSDGHLGHRTKLHPFRNGGSMATMSVVYDLPRQTAVTA